MPFVVDASAALAWCFSDETTPASQALLASLARDYAIAPAIQVANAILLARGHRLTVYDAAYLELALRLKIPLATHDGQMKTAARSEGIKLLL